jgi:hypothetical protein
MDVCRQLEHAVRLCLSPGGLPIVGFRTVLSPELKELVAECGAVQVRFGTTFVDIGVRNELRAVHPCCVEKIEVNYPALTLAYARV